MSNIVKSVVKDNTYLGLTKISLLPLWEKDPAGFCILNQVTYVAYANMRRWLKDTNTQHKFEWNNTGAYLPDYLWIDVNSDSATFFKLKYGL